MWHIGRYINAFERLVSEKKSGHPSVQTYINSGYLEHSLWNCPEVNATTHQWRLVNTSPGNGLVLSCSKPLPEPMLTQIYVLLWCCSATMSYYMSNFITANLSIQIIKLYFQSIMTQDISNDSDRNPPLANIHSLNSTSISTHLTN